jgi:hypothetical protein
MATTLRYGSVLFTNVITKSFSQETEYDESGSDPLFTKTTIRVFGVTTIDATGTNKGFITGPSGANAGDQTKQIVSALWEPRQNLVYKIGNGEVLTCGGEAKTNAIANLDVNSGPKPRVVNLTSIRGDKSVWIEFEVECALVRCTTQGADGILSNRWAMIDDIDENHYSTRTVEGVIRFAHVNVQPSAFRGLIIPPLAGGYVRQSINVTVQPDGLAARYRVTDRQVFVTPPAPLTKWNGTFTVSTADHGISQIAEIAVRGEAPPQVPKKDVITKVLQIAYTKLNLQKLNNAQLFLESASIVELMHTNEAEVRFRLRFPGQTSLFDVQATTLGIPFVLAGHDNTKAAQPSVFGASSSAGLWICYLQTPCGGNGHGIDQNGTGTNDAGGGAAAPKTIASSSTPETTVSAGTVEPLPAPNLSAEHLAALYTFYSIDTDYPVNFNRVRCPIARRNQPASGSQAAQAAAAATQVIISVAKPTAARTIKVTAERIGKEPTLPTPTDYTEPNGQKAYLMGIQISPKAAVPGPDGSQKIYAVDALFHYAYDRPLGATDPISIGQLPWVSGSGIKDQQFAFRPNGSSDAIA